MIPVSGAVQWIFWKIRSRPN